MVDEEKEKKTKEKKEKKEKKDKEGKKDKKEKDKEDKKEKKLDKKKKGEKSTEDGEEATSEQEGTLKQDGEKEAAPLLDQNGNPVIPVVEPIPPKSFAELWFDDPVEGEAAQKAALELRERIELRALSIRKFLEEAIVPLLLQGLQHMVLERPTNPAEYLAAFLLRNNPLKDRTFVEPLPDLPVPDPPPVVEHPKCQCCQLHCPAVPDFYRGTAGTPSAPVTSSMTR
ncbi:hypothetical protein R1flu_001645 [Riccia fluitans]|uniref:Uncharacterized protein n=1 Tax=Riccia fluitans TaxID=41844 RepID=A0ABD1Y4A7_9MARC